MSKISAAITAVGGYVPDFVLTNKILETMVDTNDEWITSRTGIKERRILKGANKGTSFLAIQAAKNLLQKNNLDPNTIDLVIVATATPDMKAASTAAYTASEIGATNAFAFDIDAACSSFLFGMSIVARYIESGIYKKILLIGADKNSSMISYEDRATCIIFGDGAGAVLFEPNTEGFGLQDEYLRSDGSGREFLRATHGGSANAITEDSLKEQTHFVYQDGKTVFKNAVFNMADATEKILKRNELDNDKIDWLVAHQANKRIIDATANRIKLDSRKVMMNIEKYGNTTSGTLPLLLSDYELQL
ncbi:ketoacyl-ACP synthase III, partial [Flavobacteriaceae bacterium]|nr:ketoacyl-ACP synthase III [Flavobacteriaceae bacterium]